MSEQPQLGPVVVGFDGTESGEDALALGTLICRGAGVPAIVTVVYPGPAAISPARVDAEWVADRHRAAELILERARPLVDAGPTEVEFRVSASSSGAHGLHDVAEEVGASVIVVGSQSESAEARLFAGSTAERLFAGARCPVGIAPHGLRRSDRELRRIGVAYIDTADAETALDVAARFAARAKATLQLYTVVAGEAEVMPLFIGAESERAYVATAREEYRRRLDEALAGIPGGVEAGGEVVTGDVVDFLAELGPEQVDLLFCGSRGYGPARRVLLGGVSARLVRRARSPVVVVPRGA